MSWLIYRRGRIEPFRAGLPLTAITKFNKHDCGAKQPRTFYINEGERLYWSWEKKTFDNFWPILQKYLTSSRHTQEHFLRLDNVINRALRLSQQVFKTDLKSLSAKRLIKVQQKLLAAILPAHFILNTEIDVIDVYFEDFFKDLVAHELNLPLSSPQVKKIFDVLVRPVCRTYVNKQEKSINQLARRRDFSVKSVQKLYDKFWWTGLGWESMKPYSLAYFQRLIKKKATDSRLVEDSKHLDAFVKHNLQQRQSYIKKFQLSTTIQYWLETCDQYIYLHDRRKELQIRTTYSARLILAEVARRTKVKLADAEWLWPEELPELLLSGNFDQKEIRRRQTCTAALVDYQSFQWWSGAVAQKIKNKIVKQSNRRVRILQGLGVSGGVIQGRVKVCAGAKEALAKIKKGDILVCPMTLPDYLPAMRRAQAIITEEGGVTCHAAIIAREFNIPCVVGTKIATQVLHDGDCVEINASIGLIKVLTK